MGAYGELNAPVPCSRALATRQCICNDSRCVNANTFEKGLLLSELMDHLDQENSKQEEDNLKEVSNQ